MLQRLVLASRCSLFTLLTVCTCVSAEIFSGSHLECNNKRLCGPKNRRFDSFISTNSFTTDSTTLLASSSTPTVVYIPYGGARTSAERKPDNNPRTTQTGKPPVGSTIYTTRTGSPPGGIGLGPLQTHTSWQTQGSAVTSAEARTPSPPASPSTTLANPRPVNGIPSNPYVAGYDPGSPPYVNGGSTPFYAGGYNPSSIPNNAGLLAPPNPNIGNGGYPAPPNPSYGGGYQPSSSGRQPNSFNPTPPTAFPGYTAVPKSPRPLSNSSPYAQNQPRPQNAQPWQAQQPPQNQQGPPTYLDQYQPQSQVQPGPYQYQAPPPYQNGNLPVQSLPPLPGADETTLCAHGYSPQCALGTVCVRDPRAPESVDIAICVPATQMCGGNAQIMCSAGFYCLEDPRIDCVSEQGMCLGLCV